MVAPVINFNEVMARGNPVGIARQNQNALLAAQLENESRQLQNQYYAPNMESSINNRNALTQSQTIQNQFMPEKMRLANDYQQQVNQLYAPNLRSEMANRNALTNKYNMMTPLEAQELKLKNEAYPELTKAQIAYQNAMAAYKGMGGGSAGVGQKEIMGLQRQLMNEHPDWDSATANQAASAYLSGNNTLQDGTSLPPLSGLGQTFVAQIQKRNSTAAVQNQAANMDILASDINDIDITPATKFAGAGGAANFAKYTAEMALGRQVPQEFRDYLAFKNITSNFAMDALRKGFGTSVVPDYVYSTLGKAAQPNSTWWYDPKQVSTEWNTTKDWINKNAEKYKKKATQGIGSNVSASPDTKQSNATNYSDEDLNYTAKKYNMTVDQVKQRLGIQ